jgi:hypothetical protein
VKLRVVQNQDAEVQTVNSRMDCSFVILLLYIIIIIIIIIRPIIKSRDSSVSKATG